VGLKFKLVIFIISISLRSYTSTGIDPFCEIGGNSSFQALNKVQDALSAQPNSNLACLVETVQSEKLNCVMQSLQGMFKDGAAGDAKLLWGATKWVAREGARLAATIAGGSLLNDFGISTTDQLMTQKIISGGAKIKSFVQNYGPEGAEFVKRLKNDKEFRNYISHEIYDLLAQAYTVKNEVIENITCDKVRSGLCRLSGMIGYEVILGIGLAFTTAGLGNAAKLTALLKKIEKLTNGDNEVSRFILAVKNIIRNKIDDIRLPPKSEEIAILYHPREYHMGVKVDDKVYNLSPLKDRKLKQGAAKRTETSYATIVEKANASAKNGFKEYTIRVTPAEKADIAVAIARRQKQIKTSGTNYLKGIGSCSHQVCKAVAKGSDMVIPFPISYLPRTSALYLEILKKAGNGRVKSITYVGKKPTLIQAAKGQATAAIVEGVVGLYAGGAAVGVLVIGVEYGDEIREYIINVKDLGPEVLKMIEIG